MVTMVSEKYYWINGPQAHPMAPGSMGLDVVFINATQPMSHLAGGEPEQPATQWLGPMPVESVPSLFESINQQKEPINVTVNGFFIPCMLLFDGWWEQTVGNRDVEVDWRSPLQKWLFQGFQLWAPSWDLSLQDHHEPDLFLFGQIGTHDEADSIFLIIPRAKADKILDNIHEQVNASQLAFEVTVKGQLCHRDQLKGRLEKSALDRWGGKFDYCIRVDEKNPRHSIEPVNRKTPAVYSGYIWQCVVPNEFWTDPTEPPRLRDTLFLWEHTDFTKADAVKYNLDSLLRKVEFVEKEYGTLSLLHKSSELVPGRTLYSAGEFYDYMIKGFPFSRR